MPWNNVVRRKDEQSFSVLAEIRKFYKDKKYCDLCFVCSGDASSEGKENAVFCHKIVLASISSRLRDLISIGSSEEIMFISLPDFSSSTVRKAVSAVYDALAGDVEAKLAAFDNDLAMCLRFSETNYVDAKDIVKPVTSITTSGRIIVPKLKQQAAQMPTARVLLPQLSKRQLLEYGITLTDSSPPTVVNNAAFDIYKEDKEIQEVIDDYYNDHYDEPLNDFDDEDGIDTYYGSAYDGDFGEDLFGDDVGGSSGSQRRVTKKKQRFSSTNDSDSSVAEISENMPPKSKRQRTNYEKAKSGRPKKFPSKPMAFHAPSTDKTDYKDNFELGIEETARRIIINGGWIDNVTKGKLIQPGKQRTFVFEAVVCIEGGVTDERLVAKSAIWSKPTSEDELYKQFLRAVEILKHSSLGFSDKDLAQPLQKIWLNPNKSYNKNGHSLFKLYQKKLRTALTDELGSLPIEELRAKLEQANATEVTRVASREGTSDKDSAHGPHLCISFEQFATTDVLASLQSCDRVIHLRWDEEGNVDYLNVTNNVRAVKVVNRIHHIWATDLRCQKISEWTHSLFNTMETANCIERLLDEGAEKKQCEECGEFFSLTTTKEKKAFRVHKARHRKETKVKHNCTTCGEKFLTKQKRLQHEFKFNHNPSVSLVTCTQPKCNFVGTKEELDKHEEANHSKTLVCDTCGKSYNDRAKFQMHIAIHKEFVCQECGEVVFGYKQFRKHKQGHQGPWPCDLCSYIGKSKIHLEEHHYNCHLTDAQKHYQCEVCGKGFSSPNKVTAHMMSVHIKSRPFVCKYGCGQSYNDHSTLRQHHEKRHGQMTATERRQQQ